MYNITITTFNERVSTLEQINNAEAFIILMTQDSSSRKSAKSFIDKQLVGKNRLVEIVSTSSDENPKTIPEIEEVCKKIGFFYFPVSVSGGNSAVMSIINLIENMNTKNENNEVKNEIIKAIKENNEKLLKAHIKQGIDNIRFNNEETALMLAVRSHNDKFVDLLANKENINLVDNNGNTALHIACIENCDSIVKILITNGADVMIPNKDEMYPIFIAVQAKTNCKKLLNSLLETRAAEQLKAKLNDDIYPIHLILYSPNPKEVIDVFYRKDINTFNYKNKKGQNLLFYALHQYKQDIVIWLIDRGFYGINTIYKDKQNILHVACILSFFPIVNKYKNETDLQKHDKFGRLPVHYAAQKDLNCLKALINESNLNAYDKEGFTPIMHAAESGNYTNLYYIFNTFKQVELATTAKTTVFHLAAYHCPNGLKMIMKEPKYFGAPDSYGKNLLHYLIINGNMDVIKYYTEEVQKIIDYQTLQEKKTPLMIALEEKKKDIVDFLLKNNASLVIVDTNKNNAMDYAIENGMKLFAFYFAEKGLKNNNIKNNNAVSEIYELINKGYNHLFMAVKEKDETMIDIFTSAGKTKNIYYSTDLDKKIVGAYTYMHSSFITFNADTVMKLIKTVNSLEVYTNDGWSYLNFALHYKMRNVIRYILSQGVDMKHVDKNGWNYLHFAVQEQLTDIIAIFIKDYNINTLEKTIDGFTPKDIALKTNNIDIIYLLIE